MGMYFKDKTEVLKIRVTREQAEYLERMAEDMGVSKSHVVRSVIDAYRVGKEQDSEHQ